MPDALAALLADIEREHAARAEQEAARATTAQQIARLNARTPRRGGADLAAGERDDDDARTHEHSGIDRTVDGSDGGERLAGGSQATQAEVSRAAWAPVPAEAPPPVSGPVAHGERAAEVDHYSPDPRLYSAEEMQWFYRRCDEAVAEMRAAMGAGERP